MKFTKVLLGLSVFSVLSFAMDVSYFAGIGVGHSDWTVKGSVNGTSLNYSTKIEYGAGLTEFKVGAVIDKKHKLYISLDNVNSGGDNDLKVYSLNYNYLFALKTMQLKPYIGANYSLIKYEETLYDGSGITWEKNKAELNANALLLSIGFDYVIKKHHCINFEYSFSLTASGDETVGLTYNGNSYEEKIELDKMSKWIISYNYLF